MHTRKLGNTDLELSTVGLGTWAIGGPDWKFGWGSQDDQDSIDAIQTALDTGVNWIDTAPAYGHGYAEKIVGRTIDGMTERPIIATKCGLIGQPDGDIKNNLKRESVLQECEDSLKRLGIDVIDLYQIHWPNPDPDIEEAWQAMTDLVEQGKVRYIAVSNFSVEQMERLAPIHPIASLQPPYSMIDRRIEKKLLPWCGEHNVGVVAYSPMQKGMLTDKFTREWAENLPEDDHRSKDPMFQEPHLSKELELVDHLREIAKKHDRSVANVAVAWVLRRPEVTSAIVGARNPEQARANAAAGDWTLPEEDIASIQKLLP